MPVYELSHFPVFPDPRRADEEGLLAVGGDLSVSRLLEAYRTGVFPWFDDDQSILWWSPDPRLVLRTSDLHISHGLRKLLRQEIYEIRYDTAFAQVIAACREIRRGEEHGTWITADIVDAYVRLHQLGYAHSVEVWEGDALVGGLYGIYLGRIFCGESMFHRKKDASKVALAGLADYLRSQSVEWIDCQIPTPHLASMGAIEIPRTAFLHILRQAINYPSNRRPWRLEHLSDSIPLYTRKQTVLRQATGHHTPGNEDRNFPHPTPHPPDMETGREALTEPEALSSTPPGGDL